MYSISKLFTSHHVSVLKQVFKNVHKTMEIKRYILFLNWVWLPDIGHHVLVLKHVFKTLLSYSNKAFWFPNFI